MGSSEMVHEMHREYADIRATALPLVEEDRPAVSGLEPPPFHIDPRTTPACSCKSGFELLRLPVRVGHPCSWGPKSVGNVSESLPDVMASLISLFKRVGDEFPNPPDDSERASKDEDHISPRPRH